MSSSLLLLSVLVASLVLIIINSLKYKETNLILLKKANLLMHAHQTVQEVMFNWFNNKMPMFLMQMDTMISVDKAQIKVKDINSDLHHVRGYLIYYYNKKTRFAGLLLTIFNAH